MRLCTHCGGDNPRRSIYGNYYCDDDCVGDHIESLLAALEIALPYIESFDGDNADLQTKANAEAVRAAIAKAKGEQS